MTLDDAIRHAEEVAKEQDKLCKRYDDASGYTRSGNEKIRTNEAKKCAVCAEEHRMLAWWLRDYKRLKEQEPKTGHWIEKMDACECPYCHKAWDYYDNDTEDFDYCPKCGAKLSENPTDSKDVIWHDKRNYSEIVVEPQKDKSKTEFWWNVIGGQREDL